MIDDAVALRGCAVLCCRDSLVFLAQEGKKEEKQTLHSSRCTRCYMLHVIIDFLPTFLSTWLTSCRHGCASVDGDVAYRPTGEAADAGQVEEDEDDDAIAARRARVRDRLRARRAQEAEVLEVEQEEEIAK